MKRKPRVIVFDDNEDIRLLMETVFKNNGCEVITYEDPSLCPLQQSHDCRCNDKETCTDIVLTDIDMPNVSGLDFIERQIKKGCTIKNIGIMSGLWSDENMERAKKLGGKVFEKPVSPSSIAGWVQECLERRKLGRVLSNWFLEEK